MPTSAMKTPLTQLVAIVVQISTNNAQGTQKGPQCSGQQTKMQDFLLVVGSYSPKDKLISLVMGRVWKESGSGGLRVYPNFEMSGSGISGMENFRYGRVWY